MDRVMLQFMNAPPTPLTATSPVHMIMVSSVANRMTSGTAKLAKVIDLPAKSASSSRSYLPMGESFSPIRLPVSTARFSAAYIGPMSRPTRMTNSRASMPKRA